MIFTFQVSLEICDRQDLRAMFPTLVLVVMASAVISLGPLLIQAIDLGSCAHLLTSVLSSQESPFVSGAREENVMSLSVVDPEYPEETSGLSQVQWGPTPNMYVDILRSQQLGISLQMVFIESVKLKEVLRGGLIQCD